MDQKIKHKKALFFFSFSCFSLFSIFISNSCNKIISNYGSVITIDNIIDGDTFETNNEKYRVLGIDTPETFDSSNNFEETTGPQYFYGALAKTKAKEMLLKKEVEIECLKKDKYDRWITKITLDNYLDFGSYMVANGYAIVRYISPIKNNYFYYYDANYIDNLYNLQEEAKVKKLGFWSESQETLKQIYPNFL